MISEALGGRVVLALAAPLAAAAPAARIAFNARLVILRAP